jgi:hypothetical protein
MAGPKGKPSPGGPNIWQLLGQRHPLYSQTPEENLARDEKHQDGWLDLENALKLRYGTKPNPPGVEQTPQMDPRQVGESFAKEVGLSPWRLSVDMHNKELAQARKKNLGGLTVTGRYFPDRGQIDLLDNGLADDQADTFVHELGHAADHLVSGEPEPDQNPGAGPRSTTHHAHFAQFEPEMAQIIQAQAAIENGLPVHPEILRKYPFLQTVNPRSSQPLANPWTYYGSKLLGPAAAPQVPGLNPQLPGNSTLP